MLLKSEIEITFNSIYTAKKGKVVFEFASETPGFDVAEDKNSLGTALGWRVEGYSEKCFRK